MPFHPPVVIQIVKWEFHINQYGLLELTEYLNHHAIDEIKKTCIESLFIPNDKYLDCIIPVLALHLTVRQMNIYVFQCSLEEIDKLICRCPFLTAQR